MKIAKVFLLSLILSITIFAQNDNASEKDKNITFRASGDLTLSPYGKVINGWETVDNRPQGSGEPKYEKQKFDDYEITFLSEYAYNLMLGFDVKDKFSFDIRISNPNGYEADLIPFGGGTAKGWNPLKEDENGDHPYLPTLPNAYFTWKTNNVYIYGGLLEVKGNTTLDLSAGLETGNGLYTSDANWGTIFNNSQAGVKFGFDFSKNFALNLTAGFPSNSNEYNIELPQGNDLRFILDANINAGNFTISPVAHARVLRNIYLTYDKESGYDNFRNAIFHSYGLDAGFEFGNAFKLDIGAAAGNIVLYKQEYYEILPDGNNGELLATEREKMFGFLAKAAPSLTFGINEASVSYSFGLLRYKESEIIYENGNYNKTNYLFYYNDLFASWHFRFNDYVAFGPMFAWTSNTYKLKLDYKIGDDTKKEIDESSPVGINVFRFGMEFVANF
ncbi:MAG: hypothetical protein FWF51_04135 [Chitinivibrionia bacterium]|nr:hypothetical protein [Chitinivibrionia bacterium]